MAVFLSQRWRQQPQVPVEVDWNNPLSAGLQVLVLPSPAKLGIINLVNRVAPLSPTFNATFGYRSGGTAFVHNAASSSIAFPLRQSIPSGTGARYTFAAISAWSEGPNPVMQSQVAADIRFATDFPNTITLAHWNGSSDNQSSTAVPGASAGAVYLAGYDGTKVWTAAKGISSSTAAGGLATTLIGLEVVLGWDTQGMNTYSQLLAFWNVSLLGAAAEEIANNPWQLLRPQQRRLYVNAPAAAAAARSQAFWG